jgi:cell division protein FtsZ
LDANIDGATDAVVNIASGVDIALWEVNEAVEAIQNSSSTEINIIYGATVIAELKDEIIVTVIATGFDENKSVELRDIGSSNYEEPDDWDENDEDDDDNKKSSRRRRRREEEPEEEPSKTTIPSWLKSRFK